MRLDEHAYAEIAGYLVDGTTCSEDPTNPILVFLQANGFLVDTTFDELSFLKLLHRTSRYGSHHLGLTIVLTLKV